MSANLMGATVGLSNRVQALLDKPAVAPKAASGAFDKTNSMSAYQPSNRILGVDPGLNVTGYALLEPAEHGPQLCEAGIVKGRTRNSLVARVAEIYQGIADVVAAFRPQAMALEELYSHYSRPRTAILMGHARGVICLAGAQAGIPVVHYSATQVKKILTGSGRAGKSQVQRAVQRELDLDSLPEPPDVADALAIALCHYYLMSRPIEIRG